MSLDAYLNQVATITRPTQSGTNRYNNAVTTPTVVGSDVRCRKVQKNLRMMDERTGEYAFVRVDLVLLPATYTIKPDDVLTISNVDWRVQTVMNRQRANAISHVSCVVEAINA